MLEPMLYSVERQELTAYCHRLYARKLLVGTDGNLSLKVEKDRLLVTPSGVCKADLQPDDFLIMDLSGTVIDAKAGRKPTSELPLHLVCYQRRRDVVAVVHAHPPAAIAFSVAGRHFAQCLLPEIYEALGPVEIARYSTPGTDDCPAAVEAILDRADALVMAHHGSLTVGQSLRQAYDRLERLEFAAEVSLAVGPGSALDKAEIEERLSAREALGAAPRPGLCNTCGICVSRRA